MAAPLIDQGIAQIRELIATGVLGPGSRLPPEQELAALLGCSRSTAREAVRALVTAHVLDVRRGDGTYVTSLEPKLLLEGIGFAVDLMQEDALLELWEVRRLLEPAATAKAASLISPEQLTELESVLGEMRRTVADDVALVAHDAHFHELVARAAGNQTLASILSGLSSRTMRARIWRATRVGNATEVTVAQHADILAALQAGDEDMARGAALLHVCTSEQWFRSIAHGDSAPADKDEMRPSSHANGQLRKVEQGKPTRRASLRSLGGSSSCPT